MLVAALPLACHLCVCVSLVPPQSACDETSTVNATFFSVALLARSRALADLAHPTHPTSTRYTPLALLWEGVGEAPCPRPGCTWYLSPEGLRRTSAGGGRVCLDSTRATQGTAIPRTGPHSRVIMATASRTSAARGVWWWAWYWPQIERSMGHHHLTASSSSPSSPLLPATGSSSPSSSSSKPANTLSYKTQGHKQP